MNPLEPNDPLWKLLGQGREVDARPNFAQNVARAARNTPQERGWWGRLRVWLAESGSLLPAGRLAAVAAVVVVAGWAAVAFWRDEAATAPGLAVTGPAEVKVVEAPLVPEVETQLESLDYLDALLALEDTSGLTDSEIAYLLY